MDLILYKKILIINIMKILYLLLNFIKPKNLDRIITNIDTPACKNCVYYKPSLLNNDFTSLLNKCSKFGTKNIITGKVIYDYADMTRQDENKCGNDGKYFKLRKNIIFKRLQHIFVSNLQNLLLVLFSFLFSKIIYLIIS
jgi:hypothetical protein